MRLKTKLKRFWKNREELEKTIIIIIIIAGMLKVTSIFVMSRGPEIFFSSPFWRSVDWISGVVFGSLTGAYVFGSLVRKLRK